MVFSWSRILKTCSLYVSRVLVDLFARQLRASLRLSGRVSDEAREVANQEDDVVAEVLEVLHLPHEHGMA